jgi:hypothetical protein
LAVVSSCASSDQPKEIANTGNKALDTGKPTMKTRKLGSLVLSEIGAGCMSISANYGPPADKTQGTKVIRAAHEKGAYSSASLENSEVVINTPLFARCP